VGGGSGAASGSLWGPVSGGPWSGGVVAGGLVDFQLAEVAVDGVLQEAFVARQFYERVGTLAIGVEGAGQEVALVGREEGGRHRIAVLFGIAHFGGVMPLAVLVLFRPHHRSGRGRCRFHGDSAIEAPLEEEFGGIFVVEQVLVGALGPGDAVAAGCSFACGAARAGRFFRVPAVGDWRAGGLRGRRRLRACPNPRANRESFKGRVRRA